MGDAFPADLLERSEAEEKSTVSDFFSEFYEKTRSKNDSFAFHRQCPCPRCKRCADRCARDGCEEFTAAHGLGPIWIKTVTGKTTEIWCEATNTIMDIKEKMQDKEGIPPDVQCLFFRGVLCNNSASIADYGITKGVSTLHIVLKLRGGGCSFYYAKPEYFDVTYNFDFTNVQDDGQIFYRGGLEYVRPLGSKRYAVKVKGAFEDDDWLSSDGRSGEWPVAYHGTAEGNVGGTIEKGYDLAKGKRFVFGKGIYCTPDPQTALEYGSRYNFKGKDYRLIFQSRVRPESIKLVKAAGVLGIGEYWTVPDGNHMRPYGFCGYPEPEGGRSSVPQSYVLRNIYRPPPPQQQQQDHGQQDDCTIL